MKRPASTCPGPLSRRHFLRIGSLALGGLAVNAVQPWQLRADETLVGQDTSVIFIWLPGGPPHMETYDLKPDAPAEVRGEFKPIKTVVPGMDICQHLPLHAKVADRFSLIRSVAHNFADHGGGHKKFLTGRDPKEPTGFINDYPCVGSMVAKLREKPTDRLPCYVAGTEAGRAQIDVFSFGSAYLPTSTHPFMVTGDPSEPHFKVKNIDSIGAARERVQERVGLLGQLDGGVKGLPAEKAGSIDTFRSRGLRLLTSDACQEAFDLTKEPQKLREKYGMHVWGQRALMARRLVEHGVSFVTMVMENPYQGNGLSIPKDGSYNWDSHAVNCHIFEDTKRRLPYYDRAISALVEDLHDRGLNKRVLLIVTGEFGRTPRINYAKGTANGVNQPGRDHWPQAMSMLVSGGGLQMGKVIGSTNARGEHPKDQPLTPNDLWATMFHHLGIDYLNTNFYDHRGRPTPILDGGEPIQGLI
jgi:Protein of unknown function (DUF1501)